MNRVLRKEGNVDKVKLRAPSKKQSCGLFAYHKAQSLHTCQGQDSEAERKKDEGNYIETKDGRVARRWEKHLLQPKTRNDTSVASTIDTTEENKKAGSRR